MIGDKIIIQKIHKNKAKALMPKILKKYVKGRKYIIAIGGEAGTGKSEIALILQNLLYKNGIRIKILQLDDYYDTYWSNRNQIREEKGIDYVGHKEIKWDWIDDIIQEFKSFNGRGYLLLRRINKFTDSFEFMKCDKKSIDILLIEGLYSLYVNNVDLNIYLEGSYQDTLSFRLERNKEPQTEFRQLVLLKERQEILNSKSKANIIITFNGKIK